MGSHTLQTSPRRSILTLLLGAVARIVGFVFVATACLKRSPTLRTLQNPAVLSSCNAFSRAFPFRNGVGSGLIPVWVGAGKTVVLGTGGEKEGAGAGAGAAGSYCYVGVIKVRRSSLSPRRSLWGSSSFFFSLIG